MSDTHPWLSGKRIGRRTLLGSLASLAVVATAACAQKPPGSTTKPTPSPSESPTDAATPEPEPDQGADRIELVLVRSVSDSSPTEVEYDPVTLYFGDEAIAQAKAAGSDVVEVDEDGNEYIPNDYFITESDPSKRKKMPLAEDALIEAIPPEAGTPTIPSPEEFRIRDRAPVLMEISFNSDGSQITELSEFVPEFRPPTWVSATDTKLSRLTAPTPCARLSGALGEPPPPHSGPPGPRQPCDCRRYSPGRSEE